jgi:hypothetical protein
MARAAGEVTKKRRNSKNYGGKRQPQNAKTKTIRSLDSAGLVALAKNLGRVHTIAVAPSALTDPEGADVLRGGLPALDPALFTEHVHLLHQVIVHFKIRRGALVPVKTRNHRLSREPSAAGWKRTERTRDQGDGNNCTPAQSHDRRSAAEAKRVKPFRPLLRKG